MKDPILGAAAIPKVVPTVHRHGRGHHRKHVLVPKTQQRVYQ